MFRKHVCAGIGSLIFILLFSCSQPEPEYKARAKNSPEQKALRDSLLADSMRKGKAEPKTELKDSLNELALIIAGMCDSAEHFSGLTRQPAYQKHRAAFSKRWHSFDSLRLDKLRSFHDTVLNPMLHMQGSLFYPFSGPDYLYAGQFFPEAAHYILVGLEPVGNPYCLLNRDADSLSGYFESLNRSLDAILNFSFFRTNSMEVDLKKADLDGVAHLLLLFLKRDGQQLLSCRPFVLDSLGQKRMAYTFDSLKTKLEGTAGIEIVFYDSSGKKKTLDYHCVNLSDPWLRKKPGFMRYLQQDSVYLTYLKGASYLLHKAHFSRIRYAILNSSNALVQDDSGIPLRYLTAGSRAWSIHLFGSYSEPISLFKKAYQQDLDSLYKTQGSRKLGFGIGYNFKDRNSNLMIALPK